MNRPGSVRFRNNFFDFQWWTLSRLIMDQTCEKDDHRHPNKLPRSKTKKTNYPKIRITLSSKSRRTCECLITWHWHWWEFEFNPSDTTKNILHLMTDKRNRNDKRCTGILMNLRFDCFLNLQIDHESLMHKAYQTIF